MVLKLYVYAVAIVLTVLAVFGFIIPKLVSAKDTMAVLMGGGITILTIPLVYVLVKAFISTIKSNTVSNKESTNA
jgi:hypothetical protein